MSNIKIKFWFDKDGEYGQKNNVYYSQDDGCTWEYLFNAGIGEQGPQGPAGADGVTPDIYATAHRIVEEGEQINIPVTRTKEGNRYNFDFDFGKIIPDIELKFDEATKKWYWYIDGVQSKAPVTGIQKDVHGDFTRIGGTGTPAARLETIIPETEQPYYLLTIENLKGEAGREIKIEAVTTEDNNVKIQWSYDNDPPIGSVELVQGKDYQAGRLMATRQVDNKVELESTLQAGRLMELDEETGEMKSKLQAGDNITIDEETGVISASVGNAEYIKVTYAEIVQLCKNKQLQIGYKYLITDYEFIPNPNQTSNTYNHIYTLDSEGHTIGIIVEPRTTSILSETCRVEYVQKNGEREFKDSELAEWELKYTIHNDTSLYNWANKTTGKGVIYYMKTHKFESSYDMLNLIYVLPEDCKQGIWVRSYENSDESRVAFYKRTKTQGKYQLVRKFHNSDFGFPEYITTLNGNWASPSTIFGQQISGEQIFTLFVLPNLNRFGTISDLNGNITNKEQIDKIKRNYQFKITCVTESELPFAVFFIVSKQNLGYEVIASTFMILSGDLYQRSYLIKSHFGFMQKKENASDLIFIRATNIDLEASLFQGHIDHCGNIYMNGGQHTGDMLKYKSFKYCKKGYLRNFVL